MNRRDKAQKMADEESIKKYLQEQTRPETAKEASEATGVPLGSIYRHLDRQAKFYRQPNGAEWKGRKGAGPTLYAMTEEVFNIQRDPMSINRDESHGVPRPNWVWDLFSGLEDELQALEQASVNIQSQLAMLAGDASEFRRRMTRLLNKMPPEEEEEEE